MFENDSGRELSGPDLKLMAQRYVASHLAESTFKGLSGFLEEWLLGLARLWLRAYPMQMDAASNDVADRTRAQRREEIQVPLSEILAASDRDAILDGVAERIVRDLAYRRPEHWFRFIDRRVDLGCPDEIQRANLCEMKAARDALEHNKGLVGPDYLDKAGSAARYAMGDIVEIEESRLLEGFALLRGVIEAMAKAAIRKSSGPTTER